MDNLFLFQFCLCDLFVKNEDAPCYAQPIHVKGALALGQFSARAILSQDYFAEQPFAGTGLFLLSLLKLQRYILLKVGRR